MVARVVRVLAGPQGGAGAPAKLALCEFALDRNAATPGAGVTCTGAPDAEKLHADIGAGHDGRASAPQAPANRCAGTAPTTSSIFSRSSYWRMKLNVP